MSVALPAELRAPGAENIGRAVGQVNAAMNDPNPTCRRRSSRINRHRAANDAWQWPCGCRDILAVREDQMPAATFGTVGITIGLDHSWNSTPTVALSITR